jgi:hypothetical protein
MTNFTYCGHKIQVSEIGVETEEGLIARSWDFVIDGSESEKTFQTEQEAISAASDLAERLPVLV